MSSPIPSYHPHLTAIGSYVPERKLTNADLEQLVDTNDEWIVQRTGMHERRIAREDEFTSHLAISAVQNMIDTFQVDVSDVDMILVATHTPDLPFPSVACQIQAHYNIQQTGALDLNATCAGFPYALHLANSLIASNLHRKVLVVAADTMSKITDYTDRSTCILFGDGAGAAIVESKPESQAFLGARLGTDGHGGIHVYRTGLSDSIDGRKLDGNGSIVQNGREVYRFAVTQVPLGVKELTETAGVSIADIDWFIPHSANMRIIESINERTGIPREKTLTSLEYYGNTSAASIPLALDLGVKSGKVKPGDLLLLYGFGGGLTHCGLLVRFG
ncbi:ketoacyl-ACP synthase III [Paenibacillus sp. N1-5-1-14]|uniref:ketoacyl-ACP synthase III n=1 Tax=Paenibacillus radicibacter TaxID=2972488 RepID=UPI0021599358|nr:ketoacyl-ACP synthase III [Paenibacillus radicibacter]MCR8645177.1 ketoacyl-ACP synthase III [Paenibacillus radicibacter]